MTRKIEIELAEDERPGATSVVSSADRGRPIADLIEELEAKNPEAVLARGLSSAAMRAGDLVRDMRKAARLSQSQLATAIGVKQSRISEIESGLGTQGPTWDVMERIAVACGNRLTSVRQKAREAAE
jgi:DNA-binding XRE family transcriptional regulator